MSIFRTVTETFSVSPQISAADVATAAEEGFTLIINNRPDGEDLGQPTADEIGSAARESGLTFVSVPVVGRATGEQVTAIHSAIAGSNGRVLAYCRSGTRSITAWAMGEIVAGAPTSDIVSCAAKAGYDLSGLSRL